MTFSAAEGIDPHTIGGVGGMRGLPLFHVTKFLGGTYTIIVGATAGKIGRLWEEEVAAK